MGSKDSSSSKQPPQYEFGKTKTMTKRFTALETLATDTRDAILGFGPGCYVRVLFHSIPAESLSSNVGSPLILVGGLRAGEHFVGIHTARLKRHRWFKKTLKNRDPLLL